MAPSLLMHIKAFEPDALFFRRFYSEHDEDESNFGQIPADYVVTQMEALTMIYHYCLLDNTSQAAVSQPTPLSSASSPAQAAKQEQNEILSNLLHVFLSNTDSKSLSLSSSASASVDTLAIARKILLSTLPRLVNTIAVLWRAVNGGPSSTQGTLP